MQAPKNTYANDTPNTIARSRDGAGCEEKILEKLQDAVARVRRDRDDLRRKRDIAAERLRLKSGKKEAMEANSRKVQESINKAREGVGERAKREIAELQLDVERLEKEVKFHRGELVAKRDKVSRLKIEMEEEENDNAEKLIKADDCIRKCREIVSVMREQPIQMTLSKDHIVEFDVLLNNSNFDKDQIARWAALIEQKACQVEHATDKLRLSSQSVTRVVTAYKKHFGLESVDGTN